MNLGDQLQNMNDSTFQQFLRTLNARELKEVGDAIRKKSSAVKMAHVAQARLEQIKVALKERLMLPPERQVKEFTADELTELMQKVHSAMETQKSSEIPPPPVKQRPRQPIVLSFSPPPAAPIEGTNRGCLALFRRLFQEIRHFFARRFKKLGKFNIDLAIRSAQVRAAAARMPALRNVIPTQLTDSWALRPDETAHERCFQIIAATSIAGTALKKGGKGAEERSAESRLPLPASPRELMEAEYFVLSQMRDELNLSEATKMALMDYQISLETSLRLASSHVADMKDEELLPIQEGEARILPLPFSVGEGMWLEIVRQEGQYTLRLHDDRGDLKRAMWDQQHPHLGWLRKFFTKWRPDQRKMTLAKTVDALSAGEVKQLLQSSSLKTLLTHFMRNGDVSEAIANQVRGIDDAQGLRTPARFLLEPQALQALERAKASYGIKFLQNEGINSSPYTVKEASEYLLGMTQRDSSDKEKAQQAEYTLLNYQADKLSRTKKRHTHTDKEVLEALKKAFEDPIQPFSEIREEFEEALKSATVDWNKQFVRLDLNPEQDILYKVTPETFITIVSEYLTHQVGQGSQLLETPEIWDVFREVGKEVSTFQTQLVGTAKTALEGIRQQLAIKQTELQDKKNKELEGVRRRFEAQLQECDFLLEKETLPPLEKERTQRRQEHLQKAQQLFESYAVKYDELLDDLLKLSQESEENYKLLESATQPDEIKGALSQFQTTLRKLEDALKGIEEVLQLDQATLCQQMVDTLREEASIGIRRELAAHPSFSLMLKLTTLPPLEGAPGKFSDLPPRINALAQNAVDEIINEVFTNRVNAAVTPSTDLLSFAESLISAMDPNALLKAYSIEMQQRIAGQFMTHLMALWYEKGGEGDLIAFQTWLRERTGLNVADFATASFPIQDPSFFEKNKNYLQEVRTERKNKTDIARARLKRAIKKSKWIHVVKDAAVKAAKKRGEREARAMEVGEPSLVELFPQPPISQEEVAIPERKPFENAEAAVVRDLFDSLGWLVRNPEPALTGDMQIIFNYLNALNAATQLDGQRERVLSFSCRLLDAMRHRQELRTPQLFNALLEAFSSQYPSSEDIALLGNQERTELLVGMIQLVGFYSNRVVAKSLCQIAMRWSGVVVHGYEALMQGWSVRDDHVEVGGEERLIEFVDRIEQGLLASAVGLEGHIEGEQAYYQALNVNQKLSNDERAQLLRRFNIFLHHGDEGRLHAMRQHWNEPEHWKQLKTIEGQQQFERMLAPVSSDEKNRLLNEMITLAEEEAHREVAGSDNKILPLTLFFKRLRFSGADQEELQAHIDQLINSTIAVEKLLGLAMHMRFCTARLSLLVNPLLKNEWYAELACARLAYEMQREKLRQHHIDSDANLFYRIECESACAEMREVMSDSPFSKWSAINKAGLSEFIRTYQAYLQKGLLQDLPDAPSLVEGQRPMDHSWEIKGGRLQLDRHHIQWDIAHGIIYKDGYRSSALPVALRLDHRMQELELDRLLFVKQGEWYVSYGKEKDGHREAEVRVKLKEMGDGQSPQLIIQRHLLPPTPRSLSSQIEKEWMQLCDFSDVSHLPSALRDQMGIKTWWMRESGSPPIIYGCDTSGKLSRLREIKDQKYELIALYNHETKQWRQVVTPHQLPPIYGSHFIPMDSFPAADTDHALIVVTDNVLSQVFRYEIPRLKLTFQKRGEDWYCQGGAYDGMRLCNKPGDNVHSTQGFFLERVPNPEEMAHWEAVLREAKSRLDEIQAEIGNPLLGTNLYRRRRLADCQREVKAAEEKIQDLKGRLFVTMQRDEAYANNLEDAENNYNVALGTLQSLRPLDVSNNESITGHQAAHAAILKAKKEWDALREQQAVLLSYRVDEAGHLTPTSHLAALYLAQQHAMKGEYEAVSRLFTMLADMDAPLTPAERKLLDQVCEGVKDKNAHVELLANLLKLKDGQLQRTHDLSKGADVLFGEAPTEASRLLRKLGAQALLSQSIKEPLQTLWREARCELGDFGAIAIGDELLLRHELGIPSGQSIKQLPKETHLSPIERLGFVPHTRYQHKAIVLQETQKELSSRLQALNDPMWKAQEKGYYALSFGIFDEQMLYHRLEKADALPPELPPEGFMHWLETNHWIQQEGGLGYRLTTHPRHLSFHLLKHYLIERGIENQEATHVSEQIELFFDDMALQGGHYSVEEGMRVPLREAVEKEHTHHYREAAEAEERLQAWVDAHGHSLSDLQFAYVLDEYESLLPIGLNETERAEQHTRLRNLMHRLVYHRTEYQQLNRAVKAWEKEGGEQAAINALYRRRFYDMSVLAKDSQEDLKIANEQRFARAFMMFEYNSGLRCTSEQVREFGRLIQSKIGALQMPMGSGKTELLELLVLLGSSTDAATILVVPKELREETARRLTSRLAAVGRQVFQDEFYRYQIDETNPETMLQSLKGVEADLKRRLNLYEHVAQGRHVLLQEPPMRRALHVQLMILKKMQRNHKENEEISSALDKCIESLMPLCYAKVHEFKDELDESDHYAKTMVNYAIGEKEPMKTEVLLTTATIMDCVAHLKQQGNLSPQALLKELKARLNLNIGSDYDSYLLSRENKPPLQMKQLSQSQREVLELCRALLTYESLWNVACIDQPGNQYGIWFEMKDGKMEYEKAPDSELPSAIAVPYKARGIPSAQGTRFGDANKTALATLAFYRDFATSIEEWHIQLLLEGLLEEGSRAREFFRSEIEQGLYKDLHQIASQPDPFARRTDQIKFFQGLTVPQRNALRTPIALCACAMQLKQDKYNATADRNIEGNPESTKAGFSGTGGQFSSYLYGQPILQPGVDGKMEIGVIGREDCQKVQVLPEIEGESAEAITESLLTQMLSNALENTRVLIDIAGVCHIPNNQSDFIAKTIYERYGERIGLKGVIFCDMGRWKVLTKTEDRYAIDDYIEGVHGKASQETGCYFTFYDQGRSRGANILQANGTHAIVTCDLGNENDQQKQGIKRMRGIDDLTRGQTFSTAITSRFYRQLNAEKMIANHEKGVTGNDIGVWLYKQEMVRAPEIFTDIFKGEVAGIARNAAGFMEYEALEVLKKTDRNNASERHRVLRDKLEELVPSVQQAELEIERKYGGVLTRKNRTDFIEEKRNFCTETLRRLCDLVAGEIEGEWDKNSYFDLYIDQFEKICELRESQLSDEVREGGKVGAEQVHVQQQMQMQMQAQMAVQAQIAVDVQIYQEVEKSEANYPDLHIPKEFIRHTPLQIDRATLASAQPRFTTLLKDEAVYLSEDCVAMIPPPAVQYFLYNPNLSDKTFILIGEGDADEFARGIMEKQGYVLYDIRTCKADQDAFSSIDGSQQIAGEAHVKTVRKLQWLSHQRSLEGNDVTEIQALSKGVIDPKDVEPSHKVEGDGAEFMPLKRWGLLGDGRVDLPPISITGSQEKIEIKIGNAKAKIAGNIFNRLQSGEWKERALVDALTSVSTEIQGVTQTLKQLNSEKSQLSVDYNAKVDSHFYSIAEMRPSGVQDLSPHFAAKRREAENARVAIDRLLNDQKNKARYELMQIAYRNPPLTPDAYLENKLKKLSESELNNYSDVEDVLCEVLSEIFDPGSYDNQWLYFIVREITRSWENLPSLTQFKYRNSSGEEFNYSFNQVQNEAVGDYSWANEEDVPPPYKLSTETHLSPEEIGKFAKYCLDKYVAIDSHYCPNYTKGDKAARDQFRKVIEYHEAAAEPEMDRRIQEAVNSTQKESDIREQLRKIATDKLNSLDSRSPDEILGSRLEMIAIKQQLNRYIFQGMLENDLFEKIKNTLYELTEEKLLTDKEVEENEARRKISLTPTESEIKKIIQTEIIKKGNAAAADNFKALRASIWLKINSKYHYYGQQDRYKVIGENYHVKRETWKKDFLDYVDNKAKALIAEKREADMQAIEALYKQVEAKELEIRTTIEARDRLHREASELETLIQQQNEMSRVLPSHLQLDAPHAFLETELKLKALLAECQGDNRVDCNVVHTFAPPLFYQQMAHVDEQEREKFAVYERQEPIKEHNHSILNRVKEETADIKDRN